MSKPLKKYSPNFEFEYKNSGIIVGVDEVGYGSWAGPVIAAAVVIHPLCPEHILNLIDDSKRLSFKRREEAFKVLTSALEFITWSIGIGELEDILKLSIRGATHLAIAQALENLSITPHHVLIDGIGHYNLKYPYTTIIKGDQRSYSIAAASIIAKVIRDRFMIKLSQVHSEYGWDTNMGYGTQTHQEGLKRYGITPFHRLGYKPIAKMNQ